MSFPGGSDFQWSFMIWDVKVLSSLFSHKSRMDHTCKLRLRWSDWLIRTSVKNTRKKSKKIWRLRELWQHQK